MVGLPTILYLAILGGRTRDPGRSEARRGQRSISLSVADMSSSQLARAGHHVLDQTDRSIKGSDTVIIELCPIVPSRGQIRVRDHHSRAVKGSRRLGRRPRVGQSLAADGRDFGVRLHPGAPCTFTRNLSATPAGRRLAIPGRRYQFATPSSPPGPKSAAPILEAASRCMVGVTWL